VQKERPDPALHRRLVIYGSVARGTERPDSDIDLLIIARGLLEGRMARVDDSAGAQGLRMQKARPDPCLA
jgi:hypothetical protein